MVNGPRSAAEEATVNKGTTCLLELFVTSGTRDLPLTSAKKLEELT